MSVLLDIKIAFYDDTPCFSSKEDAAWKQLPRYQKLSAIGKVDLTTLSLTHMCNSAARMDFAYKCANI